MTLCVFLVLTVDTKAHALTPQQEQIEQKGVKWVFEKLIAPLFEKKSGLSKEISASPEDLQLTRNRPLVITRDGALVIWLVLAGVFGAATVKGLASVAGRNKETLAIPESLRSIECGVREPQDADVTVMAPRKARPREDIVVEVIIHTPDREREARPKRF